MKLKVFAIYDSKAEAYMQPFMMQTRGQAIRSFSDLVNDGKSQLNKHPEDFTLFEIADFEDQKGIYTPLKTHASCGIAIEFVQLQALPNRKLSDNVITDPSYIGA